MYKIKNIFRFTLIPVFIATLFFTGFFTMFASVKNVSANQETCESSGGTWIDRVEGPTLDNSYCSCPVGNVLIGQLCEAPPQDEDDTPFTPSEINCEAEELTRDNCGIINYLVIAINFLSAVAIMAIVASVMFAGYQYMTARDNPGAVAAAKSRIIMALVALAVFVFGYGLLNFLVPGGVL